MCPWRYRECRLGKIMRLGLARRRPWGREEGGVVAVVKENTKLVSVREEDWRNRGTDGGR